VSRSLTRVTIDDSAGRSCGARILLESLAWALYSVTCPDALMSCWKATSGLVIEHLACERAAMGWPRLTVRARGHDRRSAQFADARGRCLHARRS